MKEEKKDLQKAEWNPGALLAPVPPTLVSCGSMENPRVLTVAWTGILCTKPPKTYISIRPERNSYPVLKEAGVFTINLPSVDLVREVDFCGVRSGAQVDKFAHLGLTAVAGVSVGSPSIAQCPISLECRVTEVLPLGSHHMFLADIVKVLVREDCIDPVGKLLLEKCNLLAYAHGSYFALGEGLGTFGFSVRKKPPAGKKGGAAQGKPSGKQGAGGKKAVERESGHSKAAPGARVAAGGKGAGNPGEMPFPERTPQGAPWETPTVAGGVGTGKKGSGKKNGKKGKGTRPHSPGNGAGENGVERHRTPLKKPL